jgi:hypothetical protein
MFWRNPLLPGSSILKAEVYVPRKHRYSCTKLDGVMIILYDYILQELILCIVFYKQDYDGQRRAEKLSRIIITLFGVSNCLYNLPSIQSK